MFPAGTSFCLQRRRAQFVSGFVSGFVFANVNAPRPTCVRGRLLPLLGVPEKQAWKITGVPGSAPRNKFVDESMIHSFRTMMFHIIDGCGQ